MNIKRIFILLFLQEVIFYTFALQPDTLKIKQAHILPIIDGLDKDSDWINESWIDIDQVWIPYQKNIAKVDFAGRYKVLWSENTNLLYFIAEITDDVFCDGYVYDKKNRNYADYDIFEVFIDPDHSGGLHVFDGKCDNPKNEKCWGINAENAFTYHINVKASTDGEITNLKSVEDISGKSWHNLNIRNYADHFPQFAFRKMGNIYTYEFSLKVYKDSFDPKMPSETARDSLYVGKVMGMSVAYCDSDLKTEKPQRKSFIGSTIADGNALDTKREFNKAWMNASFLGFIVLSGY